MSASQNWPDLLTSLDARVLLDEYGGAAAEPPQLAEAIGRGLGSPREETRARAFWALVILVPELTDLIHERETREPGWRKGTDEGQTRVNEAVDIVSHLYRKLVGELGFRSTRGSDPRRYVRTAIKHWQQDEWRKTQRESSLDLDPTDARASDGELTEAIAREETRAELLSWNFIDERELPIFESVYVEELPLAQAAARFGLSSEQALRQKLSRARKKAVMTRDAMLTSLLIEEVFKGWHDRLSWFPRAMGAIEKGPWLPGYNPSNGGTILICPLTRGLGGAAGHLYLLAIRSDVLVTRVDTLNGGKIYSGSELTPESEAHFVWQTTKRAMPTNRKPFVFCQVGNQHRSELPRFNKALRGLGSRYYAWVFSTARLPVVRSFLYHPIHHGIGYTSGDDSRKRPEMFWFCAWMHRQMFPHGSI